MYEHIKAFIENPISFTLFAVSTLNALEEHKADKKAHGG